MKSARLAAFLVVALFAARAEAAIDLTAVVPHRTTCKAPCAVFLDGSLATGLSGTTGYSNDYVAASFYWDFDSTGTNTGGEPHRNAVGFAMAHTYDTPGTYTIAIGVIDVSGATATATRTVTVSAMTGTTYYVSSGGSGTTCSIVSPCSLATGLTHVATNNSVLLRRGDSFTKTTAFSIGVTGPFILGSYSDPGSPSSVAPAITLNVSSGNIMGDVNSSTDVRITDLHFIAGTGVTVGWQAIGSSNALFERFDQEGTSDSNVLVEDISDHTFFTDIHLHDYTQLGIYGDRSKYVAIVGANIEKYSGGDHGTRIQGGNPGGPGFALHTVIAYSTYTPTIGGGSFDCFAIRGDNTDAVVVGNTCASTVSCGPQNDGVLEHVTNVLWDSNQITIQESPFGSTGINIEGQHVYARNNVIDKADVAIRVSGSTTNNAAGWYTGDVFLYNNVFNGGGSYLGTTTHQVIGITHGEGVDTPGNVTAINNIWNFTGSATNSQLFLEHGTGTSTIDHNLWWSTSATLSSPTAGTNAVHGDPQFVSTTLGNPNYFWIPSTSAARDAGISTAMWYDRVGTLRPQGSAWDIGAVEYVTGGNPSPGKFGNRPISYGAWFVLLLAVGLGVAAVRARRARAELADAAHVHLIDSETLLALREISDDGGLSMMLTTMCKDCGEPLFLPRTKPTTKGT